MSTSLQALLSASHFNQHGMVLRRLVSFFILTFGVLALSSCHLGSGGHVADSLSTAHLNQMQFSLEREAKSESFFLSVRDESSSASLGSRFSLSATELNSIPRMKTPLIADLGLASQRSLFFVYDGLSDDGKVSVVEWKYNASNDTSTLVLGRVYIVPFFHLLGVHLSLSEDGVLIANAAGTKSNPGDRVLLQYDIANNATNLNPVKISMRRD